MRIVHYFLGPHRQGGLNRYVRDLASCQSQTGDTVTLLYPIGGVVVPKEAELRQGKPYKGMACYELAGGIPVPLLEGVRDPQMILSSVRHLSDSALESFIQATSPEVLHIHTWMGFPEELLAAVRSQGGRVVYTTHDYYGLCPRVNFIDWEGSLCGGCTNERCSECNRHAPGERTLALRNCAWLLRLKGMLRPVYKLLSQRKCDRHGNESRQFDNEKENHDYEGLKRYYVSLLEKCDVIHCNSQITEKIYRKELFKARIRVLGITHGGIGDHRYLKEVDGRCVRLGYSGSGEAYKGLPQLLKILEELPYTNWRLDVWGTGEKREAGRVHYCGNYGSFGEAFKDTDLMIVPSVWYETFGFIVLESLSFGISVLCSDRVGAQCLVDSSMVYHGEVGLRRRLEELLAHPAALSSQRLRLCKGEWSGQTMSEHCEQMKRVYFGQ